MPGELSTITIELNGRPFEARVDPGASLLEVLRVHAGIRSVKDGCSGQATCGCCTVLVDGAPKLSCALPAARVAGRKVVTLEGLPDHERHELARAFAATGAVQCGFCTPGIVLRAKALLDQNPEPDEAAIRKVLDFHLCRCTGFVKIVEAIRAAAAARRGAPLPEPGGTGRVGEATTRLLAEAFALGERPYVADLDLEGLAEGALVFARVPRGRLVSIDAQRAREAEGVLAVATAADLPGDNRQGTIVRDWPVFVPLGGEVRYAGDVVAAVAATSRRAARVAARLVEFVIEPLPAVTDPEAALSPGAPRLHEGGNVLSRSVVRRGDARRALAASAHVVEETFTTQFVEHAFLEVESAIAVPPAPGGRWRFYSQGQGIFDDRSQLAAILGVPDDAVEVELVSPGGAFGGKEDLSVQGHAAALAAKSGVPCRVTLSRDESILFHPKRHPMRMEYRVGCDAQGRLTAVAARIVGDTGAYASVGSKVVERAAQHAVGAYSVDDVEIEALAVYTNNPPCGAMRGFGVNQVVFAVDGCLDRLAERVGIDGWEIRWRNALEDGDRFGTGQVLHAVGLKKTLEAVRDAYRGARHAGIACGVKNVGIGNGMPDSGQTVLEVTPEGGVRIVTGFTEMGQGLFTVLAQIVREVTGLPLALMEGLASTTRPVPCGMTTASRGTVLAGNATLDAARRLGAALREAGIEPDVDPERSRAALSRLSGRSFLGMYVCDWTTSPDAEVVDPVTHLAFSFATHVVTLDDQGRLERVIAAHDVGRVLNPLALSGQIEGSIHMGLGFALSEELRLKGGIPGPLHLGQLGILRARHMPRVECVFIEETEREGPFGAKGAGEIGLVPTAAAVAGALHAFDGRWRNRLPMKNSAAAAAILGPVRAGRPAGE